MRLTLIAALFGLVGCANGGVDPGSVVQGLSQEQIDQTQWLFNAEASDLVDAADLQGPATGYEIVRVRRINDAIVIWNPNVVGEEPSVLRGGGIRPDGGGGDGNPDGVAPGPSPQDVSPEGRFSPGTPNRGSWRPENGFERFDEAILAALQGEEGFFVFHPGCA